MVGRYRLSAGFPFLESRDPPSAKKIVARSELCGTQRVKKLHTWISAASSLLQGHIHGGEKLALSDLHEAVMKQHEAPHIQGEQKLQSRIIDEAAEKQQFFNNAVSLLLHRNPGMQVFQHRCFIPASRKSESASFPPLCNGLEAAMKQQKSESASFCPTQLDTHFPRKGFLCLPMNGCPCMLLQNLF